MDSPLHHFELHPLIRMSLMGFDISINKAVIAMWIGMAVFFGLFMVVVRKGVTSVPGKLQSVLEIMLEFIQGMVNEFIGKEEGKKYFSFIASIFIFILSCNLIGLIPVFNSFNIFLSIIYKFYPWMPGKDSRIKRIR